MSLLEVVCMSHSYGDKTLYKQVTFDLCKGEHLGVVGQNGTGKSTLIGILTGEIIPDEGTVKWQPALKLGHLDQHAVISGDYTIMKYLQTAFDDLFELENKMGELYAESAKTGNEALLLKAAQYQEQLEKRDFYSMDSTIHKVVNGLGINAIGIERPIRHLSGGQRAKVILAKLLLEQPDVLLLDEPTNFLDKEHVEWLAGYLTGFQNAFVVVSHNQAFLEKVTTSICDIEGETVKKYYGIYSHFLKQKEHLREDHIRRYHAQQKQIEKTEQFIRKNIAGVNSKIARGRRKQLDRLDRIAPPAFASKPSFRFRELPLSAQVALKVNGLEVGYGGTPLLTKLNFSVPAGEKLVVSGFNGIGKSTLLRTLLGRIPAVAGSYRFAEQTVIGYYEQDLIWDDDEMTPIEIIAERYPKLSMKEIRRHLAQCGLNETHVAQAVRSLSGGEQAKVKLCRLLLSPCHLLVMDEPTNHLDAEAKDALRKALIDFDGTVILVTHDQSFYEGWADRLIDIEHLGENHDE